MEYKILLTGASAKPLSGLFGELVGRGHKVEQTDLKSAYLVYLKSKPNAVVVDCSSDQEAALKLMRLVRIIDQKTGMILVAPDPKKTDEDTDKLLVWSVHPVHADPDAVAEEIEQACELAVLPKEQELEIAQACETETEHLQKIQRDMLNETGLFKPFRDIKGLKK